MFLAVAYRHRILQSKQLHSGLRHFRCHGLVPEIQAQPVRGRFADDTCQQDRSVLEVVLWADLGLAKIPQHRGARADLDVATLRQQCEGGCATCHHTRHRKAVRAQLFAHLPDRREGLLHLHLQRDWTAFTQMSVVSMQPGRNDTRRAADGTVQRGRRVARGDAGAVHADVEVDVERNLQVVVQRRAGDSRQLVGVIHQSGKARARKSLRQGHESLQLWPHRLAGQQDVLATGRGRHLGFRDGRCLELVDARSTLQGDDVRRLVRFHMRPQALHRAGHGNHALQVVFHPRRIHQQGGGADLPGVGDAVPVVHCLSPLCRAVLHHNLPQFMAWKPRSSEYLRPAGLRCELARGGPPRRSWPKIERQSDIVFGQ